MQHRITIRLFLSRLFLLMMFVLASKTVSGQSFDVDTLVYNGDPTNHINFIYLGDGFTQAQMSQFITKAKELNNAIFNTPPFSNYASFFNAFAIKVPSPDSGAKHPGTATDVTEPASPIKNPNTYFSSTFDVSNIHRLLVGQSFLVQTVAFANFPEYDQILLVVNDGEYGGSGGSIATGSVNGAAAEIMIHEIGHSFAGLGDEYWFNCGETKNRTSNSNPASIIWKNWLNVLGVGIYPIGSSGPASSCYRPHQNCKMRALGQPFCAVCKEAIIDRIYGDVGPINGFSPSANQIEFTTPSMDFSLDLKLPNPNTLAITWLLNGDTLATNVDSLTVTYDLLTSGSNTLQAIVSDQTNMSRSFWPASSGYLHAVSWDIHQSPLEVDDLNFQATYDGRKVKLSWRSASGDKTAQFNVYKSLDGLKYHLIETVKPEASPGIKDYVTYDAQPFGRTAYYRLDQVDQEDHVLQSQIRAVNKSERIAYTISPNPLEEILTIQLKTESPDGATIFIYDITGRRIHQKEYKNASNVYEEINTGTWPAGAYILELRLGGLVQKEMVLKKWRL